MSDKNTNLRCVTIGIAPALALFGGLLMGTADGASNLQERETIQRFSDFCQSDTETEEGKPFVELRFAPVRELDSNETPQYGTWGHTYETDDHQYAGNRYVIGTSDNEIDLVSIMRAPKSTGDLPRYLWHVISVPNPSDDRVGFVARHKEFTDKERGIWNSGQYNDLRRSEVKTEKGTILFYVKLGLAEDIISNITNLWRTTFRDAMKALVLEHYESDSRIYTHTFIYQDVPQAVGDINKAAGDRRNSSRRVLAPGTAFGFVLDDAGACFASTTLTIDTLD